MRRWIAIVVFVDISLLMATLKVRTFCGERLLLSVRGFERGIIAAYFVCSAIAAAPIHSIGGRSALLLCDVFVCVGMWLEHRKSSTRRMYKLVDLTWILLRTLLAGLAVMGALADLLPPPHHWFDIAMGLETVWFAALHYATSLPGGEGRRGRSRRLAWAKLKEMFGSWLPAPEPEAA